MEFFTGLHPALQALILGIFTWGITGLGAALVFTFKTLSKKFSDILLGFAAGVMTAASFWSLLDPGIEISRELGQIPWLTAAAGFIAGGVFLLVVNKVVPLITDRKSKTVKINEGTGIPKEKKKPHRSFMLTLAVTLHNIPEGLAIGVAIGSVSAGLSTVTVAGAVMFAVGIGIQNFPEGAAISLPLRADGYSRRKSFFIGQISGIVEPVFAVIGALLVMWVRALLPYALAFAAGAMILVVVKELIPESQTSSDTGLATLGMLFGFALMMVLDVALS